jgi:hypothetical protein
MLGHYNLENQAATDYAIDSRTLNKEADTDNAVYSTNLNKQAATDYSVVDSTTLKSKPPLTML